MNEKLDQKIAGLATWTREALLEEWARLYPAPVSKKTSSPMLRFGIAFRWQEMAYGGLKPEDQRLLDRMAQAFARDPGTLRAELQIKIGTRLRRLWQGKVYEVTTQQEGFVFDGKKFGSLSEIARLITGTRWNGRVFFGLKAARGKAMPKGGADEQASA